MQIIRWVPGEWLRCVNNGRESATEKDFFRVLVVERGSYDFSICLGQNWGLLMNHIRRE
jgi:hypothetical protein